MADCFITRRGGGGSGGLNFEVVGGTTQPTNPKENTIWINTDEEITEWIFSSTEPETPAEGMVWVTTASSSTAPINVTKKNTVMLYPQSAKQYLSGAWISLNASVYVSGAWASLWNGYLFDFGDQYEVITGGWYQYSREGYGGTANIGEAISLNAPSGTTAAATMHNKIDLSNYNSIEIYVSSFYEHVNLIVAETNSGYVQDNYVMQKNCKAKGWHSADVSSLSGEYYIYITCGNGASGTVDQIRLA